MNLIENVRLAISGLATSKMRSFLTMLGIIIGISSVITIVTLGNAMTSQVTDMVSSFGINNIDVLVYPRDPSGGAIYEEDFLTDEMLERFQKHFSKEVKAVSISENAGTAQVRDGRKYANISITGVNDGFAISNDFKVEKGRFINARDVKGGKKVAVVSDLFVANLFPAGTNPIGEKIKVQSADGITTYSIIGIYKFERSAFDFSTQSDEDRVTDIYVPLTATGNSYLSGKYAYVTVAASDAVNATEFSQEISEYFNTREYAKNTNCHIMTYSNESMLEEMTTVMDTLSLAVAFIAAISLFVGGIGVMNIMLVSVTERTREIGTRKALGARNSAIRAQFIVEAVIICAIGGIIGVTFGITMGNLGAALLQMKAQIDVGIIIISVLFSMSIGMFFGYYPANKAAKLDPIEALRYE